MKDPSNIWISAFSSQFVFQSLIELLKKHAVECHRKAKTQAQPKYMWPPAILVNISFPFFLLEAHGPLLENYVHSVFNGKVRVLHAKEHLGLIGGRLYGIEAAIAPVVVVLDAHMEMRDRWLEPLVYEIAKNKRIMANVYMDWMKPQDDGMYGMVFFLWWWQLLS